MEQTEGVKPGHTKPDVWPPVVAAIKDGSSYVTLEFSKAKMSGVMSIEASVFECYHPIGLLYYRHQAGNTISIEYIFVVDKMRGAGIAKKMVEMLLDYAFNQTETLAVLTSRVNQYSEAVLTSVGFEWDEATDCWGIARETK